MENGCVVPCGMSSDNSLTVKSSLLYNEVCSISAFHMRPPPSRRAGGREQLFRGHGIYIVARPAPASLRLAGFPRLLVSLLTKIHCGAAVHCLRHQSDQKPLPAPRQVQFQVNCPGDVGGAKQQECEGARSAVILVDTCKMEGQRGHAKHRSAGAALQRRGSNHRATRNSYTKHRGDFGVLI